MRLGSGKFAPICGPDRALSAWGKSIRVILLRLNEGRDGDAPENGAPAAAVNQSEKANLNMVTAVSCI